ncbi:hypothetical protein [Natronohydrobacter thiooxidans]|jgi:hypothetical protein|uniref:hypothetical protein n=1 Tax=Natronohydrobacter thiooxidans TaxID=87172 RepID=UPI0008FF40DC|nr:hypothetical protein [Natronohydrobacter thiooxidans]
MDREEFKAFEARVEARAARLWSEAGSPDGGHKKFIEQARELVALEEVGPPTRKPAEDARPIVEEASIQSNLGEFPTLRDQGEEMTHPDPELANKPKTAEDIRLSDEDASDTGGVLPDDDLPER